VDNLVESSKCDKSTNKSPFLTMASELIEMHHTSNSGIVSFDQLKNCRIKDLMIFLAESNLTNWKMQAAFSPVELW
jgi:hypothetical protein